MGVVRRLCTTLAVVLLVGAVAPEGARAGPDRAAQGAPEHRVIRMTGPLGEALQDAFTLNGRGQVIGTALTPNGVLDGVVWDGRAARASYIAPWWAPWVASWCPPYMTVAGPQDISDQGQVVGANHWPLCRPPASAPPWAPRSTAFSWSNGLWADLTYGPGQGSAARAVNDRGQVIGFEAVPNGAGPNGGTVFAWQNGVRLTVPASVRGLTAWDLNDRGQALLMGASDDTPARSVIAIWDIATGAVTEVDLDLPPDTGVSSLGINELGQVIVSATTIGTGPQAARTYLWDGEVVDLGGLGVVPGVYGRDDYHRNSKPLNDLGHVVVQGTTADGEQHAFLWRDGEATDLGTLGGDYSVGYAVNNHDEVVGQSRTADGELHAFLWRRGQMTDLGALTGEEGHTTATQINDAGDIIGLLTRPYPDFPPDAHTYQPLFWTRTR